MLVVLLLGNGLVELPRKFWRLSRPAESLLRLQFRATAIDTEVRSWARQLFRDHTSHDTKTWNWSNLTAAMVGSRREEGSRRAEPPTAHSHSPPNGARDLVGRRASSAL